MPEEVPKVPKSSGLEVSGVCDLLGDFLIIFGTF